MDIKIPEVGESITEGTISAWIKNEGDQVKAGDMLLELETDKVNLEISAETDGVLDKIYKNAGDNVKVGEVIGVIRAAEAGGTKVDAGQKESPALVEPSVNEASVKNSLTKDAQENPQSVPKEGNDEVTYKVSPSVRKLARERGIDLNQVRPADSKASGRILREDIESYPSNAAAGNAGRDPDDRLPNPNAAEKPAKPAEREGQASGSAKPYERKRMSRRRLTIANHLLEAQRTAAMLTTFNEVDMTAILDLRRRRKQSFQEKHEVGLGFMSFFCKAVVGALKAFPLLNAEIDGEDILIKKHYDIGIAVAAKEGLVVPVVRDVDRLGFAEIEKRIAELAAKARGNTLALSDLQGGTFTITNGGVFGSLLSTPILNMPQVGILGMHTIQKRPVAIDDDKMENRPMMYIALSYDHRIVDGSDAVRFLVTVKELLEDAESLLLEG
jgi:2-oxoglutarate dehydrogenase E2 component (dihydrolipoamide succinyltransferase)